MLFCIACTRLVVIFLAAAGEEEQQEARPARAEHRQQRDDKRRKPLSRRLLGRSCRRRGDGLIGRFGSAGRRIGKGRREAGRIRRRVGQGGSRRISVRRLGGVLLFGWARVTWRGRGYGRPNAIPRAVLRILTRGADAIPARDSDGAILTVSTAVVDLGGDRK